MKMKPETIERDLAIIANLDTFYFTLSTRVLTPDTHTKLSSLPKFTILIGMMQLSGFVTPKDITCLIDITAILFLDPLNMHWNPSFVSFHDLK
jgi:hypothetical protein